MKSNDIDCLRTHTHVPYRSFIVAFHQPFTKAKPKKKRHQKRVRMGVYVYRAIRTPMKLVIS